jgi:hypothetical protein
MTVEQFDLFGGSETIETAKPTPRAVTHAVPNLKAAWDALHKIGLKGYMVTVTTERVLWWSDVEKAAHAVPDHLADQILILISQGLAKLGEPITRNVHGEIVLVQRVSTTKAGQIAYARWPHVRGFLP